ncbi:hypothetical protein JCM33374_g3272 [Metschnikowia sp. JCM 33374]|nr:hypothetical protein JCM33374_g3272 [Metschnikowia sp. JCM 33374]
MQVAKLAVHQDDAEILLKERNKLDQVVMDKYRTAGSISQTTLKYVIQLINDSYHLHKTERPYSSEELCILGDSMMVKLLGNCYNNSDKVREKGIAHPVTIEVNEFVTNVSPELDQKSAQLIFQAGDIVTISLGAQIDGYTALVSHTLVIYPPGVMIDNELKPEGPLLGSKADAIVACNIATKTVIALLGLALHPEKIAWIPELSNGTNVITGTTIRQVVDRIAASFGCVVVPGSKVRRVRRFLAGQAEGVVAERDFKGVVWDESDQEEDLLKKAAGSELIVHDKKKAESTNVSSAIPTDEFVVEAGEAYNIDLRFCGMSDFEEKGLITLQEVEATKPTIYIRDFAVTHYLKLNSARELLALVDKDFSVYPFKLSHTCDSFPVDYEQGDIVGQLGAIKKEIVRRKLGLNELANRYLARPKPVQMVKHVPFSKILTTANPTGRHGIDSSKLTLPGKEVPLPALGISALKLKSLLKFGTAATAVAREATTILLNDAKKEVVRLTGGDHSARPSWVHSKYQVSSDIMSLMSSLDNLNYTVKEVQPVKLNTTILHLEETMQLD